MTTWLELHQEMPKHKKTLALARLLRVDRRCAIGLMIDLWTWGLDNADADGRLVGLTADDLEMAMDWPAKKSGKLVDALVQSRWLDRDGATYILHDWADYTSRLNEQREIKREQARVRQQRRREKLALQNGKSNAEKETCHANVTRDKRDNNAPTVPNPTVPYNKPLTPVSGNVTKSPYETGGVPPEQARDFERVAKAYTEQVDPMPSSKDCDLLFRLTAEHGAGPVLDAIRETARSGGHSAAYLRKVLDGRARDTARASPLDDNLEDL